MGKRIAPDEAHLSAASDDIRRSFPDAGVRWDTGTSPYMVSVSLDGVLVRVFVEPAALVEREARYDEFTRRVSELLIDAQRVPGRSREGPGMAAPGGRAPLSAAKVSARGSGRARGQH